MFFLSKKLDEKPGFTPRGEVAYLVDMEGYGKPASALSKRYLDERVKAVNDWSAALKITGLIAGLLVVAGAGLFSLSRAILGRAMRIGPDFELLKPDSSPTVPTHE